VERGGDLLEGELAGSDRDHAALDRGQLDALAVRLDADVGDDAAAAGDQFDVSVGEQVWLAVALGDAADIPGRAQSGGQVRQGRARVDRTDLAGQPELCEKLQEVHWLEYRSGCHHRDERPS
jgi:hypothetical protein